MRNKFRIGLLSMVAVGLVGCSDKLADESGGINDPGSDEGKVYMSVAVSLPSASGTRSATDTEGDTNSDAKPKPNGSSDYEIGHDNENKIKSIVLVLASKDGKYIAHNLIESDKDKDEEAAKTKKYTAKASFSRAQIASAYETNGLLDGTDKTVNVYAFCNKPELDEYFKGVQKGDDKWLDKVTKIGETDEPVFFMSNSSVRKVKFPETAAGWASYNVEDNPFNLTKEGSVYVERAAARFDYRMSSDKNAYVDAESNANLTTYNYGLTGNDELGKIVNVALAKMSLVNMSNEYYNLRRVSDDGTPNGANFERSGAETPGNYVVDTDWQHKKDESHKENVSTLGTEFNFPLFMNERPTSRGNFRYNYENKWYTKTIHSVLSQIGEDNEDTWDGSEGNRYKIWRYVTENTIPSDDKNQIAAHSTGVVFKAAIVADEDIDKVEGLSAKLIEALKASKAGKKPASDDMTGDEYYNYPDLFLYGNQLYAGIEELVAAAAKDKEHVTVLRTLIERVLNNWYLDKQNNVYEYKAPNDVKEGDEQLTVDICNTILNDKDNTDYKDYKVDFVDHYNSYSTLKGLIVDQNIAVYKADNDDEIGGGYFCYYFYWNRHNDNGDPANMGRMEFATVRNNVYKLTVSTISRLGHPTDPDDDPDPVQPDDPDEEDKVYMKVNVEVLPWVVRVNDIQF